MYLVARSMIEWRFGPVPTGIFMASDSCKGGRFPWRRICDIISTNSPVVSVIPGQ